MPKPIPPGTLVISNMDEGDDTFQCDVGWWNVTRAKRDCAKGKHKLYLFDVAELYETAKNVEVDRDRVEQFMGDPKILSEPVILIGDFGKVWLIDGHHRIRAMHRVGTIKDCMAYVIEEVDAAPYRIWFQGNQRKPPWEIQ